MTKHTGPTEYWNHNDKAVAMVNNKTERFRPVVPSAVLPKQAWQRLPAAVQKHQVMPMVSAEEIAAPIIVVLLLLL